jgi:thioesterase domain-containing protein
MKINGHDLLIPIQLGKSHGTPLFCIPGAGANIAYFRPLAAKLGADATVYGFQGRGLDGESLPHTTVEATVEDYMQALQPTRADEPLRLIGHSFGGWVAFELASRWREAGRSVAPLIMLDTEAPHHQDHPPRQYDRVAALLRLVEILEQSCEMSLGITEQDSTDRSELAQLQLLRDKMIGCKLISLRTPMSAIEDMFKVFSANLNTVYYPGRVYSDPVHLIRARGGPNAPPRASRDRLNDEGWRHYASQFVTKDGPGNHMTMLAERHADELARLILTCGFAP